MKQKLELTWVGKEERARLEPRILLEEPERSYVAPERVAENDLFDNRLIFGDNLLALKALEQEFTGQVKCIFIDPPYNTGSAFTHYDDGLEHSLWLTMMRDRLEILRNLLSEDGSIWITLDDNEAHYFKVMADEVFGRSNFVGTVIWQHSIQGKNDAKLISLHHNNLFAYRKSEAFQRRLLPRTEDHNVNYRNPDDDPRGDWRAGDVRSPNYRENLRYVVITPSGKRIEPPDNGWRWSEELFWEKVRSREISFVNDETRVLRKIYLADQEGRVPESIWWGKEAGTSRDASNHVRAILGGLDAFDTPKPEQLVERVLQLSTMTGDLVLDSFAGSGTTGAVAHKLGRRWIMIELGEHCHTHIIPRMQKVIDGIDQGGISKAVGWKGGGGFRYYRLAPTLLMRDRHGRLVINEAYNPEMLAEAMCKHMGFVYQPSQDHYWIHGVRPDSDDRSYLYVTTQHLTGEALASLSEAVGDPRHLAIACCAYDGDAAKRFTNLEVQKIPQAILSKCEFGEDYEERISKLGWRAPEPEPESPKAAKSREAGQMEMFDEEVAE